jgi:hypothetical protein
MNAIRLLCGTFGWHISEIPTSLDIAFNQAKDFDLPKENNCKCEASVPFFSIDSQSRCHMCGSSSSFISTASRIQSFNGSKASLNDSLDKGSNRTASFANKNFMARIKAKTEISEFDMQPSSVLKDITNLTNNTNRRSHIARPDDSELNRITQVNVMLSNFVVSYFFKIFAGRFDNILFTEFLFDFVKRDGGWKSFVQSSRKEGHYTNFFAQLSHHKSICIVPICCHTHWTIIIRKFIGNSWKIFFVDSIEQGSDQRFRDWQYLFQDDDLFSGTWIKVKVFQQNELECGARACLHGFCFALSNKKNGEIINDLSRFKDLSVRSRLMVSTICKEGYWISPKWLRRKVILSYFYFPLGSQA